MDDLRQVEALVNQVKGNTSFLQKIIFRRMTFLVLGIVSGVFLIAAMTAS